MRGIPWCTLVWGARYTLGARYLSKNTVLYLSFVYDHLAFLHCFDYKFLISVGRVSG